MDNDEKTLGFPMQARMYAYLSLDRLSESLATGEKLLRHHESAGSVVGMAKTLADLARAYMFADQVGEAVRCLARMPATGPLRTLPMIRESTGRQKSPNSPSS